MTKYLVETYYTCSFKIVHKLDELNEKKLSELQNRNDGQIEIIDVKLNNRKTKTLDGGSGSKSATSNKQEIENIKDIPSIVTEKINNSEKLKNLDTLNNQKYNKLNHNRSKMPDRRKGYI